jgi:hypothetical protein
MVGHGLTPDGTSPVLDRNGLDSSLTVSGRGADTWVATPSHARGAHLLLQVRTRVLNDELADDFHRWFPGFTHTALNRQAPAA